MSDLLLTEHFHLSEFLVSQTAARLGIDNSPGPGIVNNLRHTAQMLELVRDLVRQPVIVTSGYRCATLNVAVGGAADSAHLFGQAADIHCPGMTPLALCIAIQRSPIPYDQLIFEFSSWCHIAWSSAPRREQLTIDASGTRPGF